MKTLSSLLFLLAVSLGCSSPETGTESGGSTSSGGEDAGVPDAGACITAADCVPSSGPCIWVSCQTGVCTVTTCDDGDACTDDVCNGGACSYSTATSPAKCDDGKGWCNPSAADGGPVECCHGCLVHDGAVFSCAPVCPLPNTCSAQGLCVIQ